MGSVNPDWKYNWYVELGLAFDPPVTDQTVIAQRIDDKRKEWSMQANNPMKGAKAKQFLQEYKSGNIAAQMQDEDYRAWAIGKAKDQIYSVIDGALLVFVDEIPLSAIEQIAKTKKCDVELVKKRAAAKHLKVVAAVGPKIDTAAAQRVLDRYQKKPAGTEKYAKTVSLLQVVQASNLYHFIAMERGEQDERKISMHDCRTLRQFAAEIKQRYPKENDSDGARRTLCDSCVEEAFSSDKDRALYDEYLAYNKRQEVLSNAKMAFDYGGWSEQVFQRQLSALTGIMRDESAARQLLEAYCVKFSMPFQQEVREAPVTTRCRCGCVNHVRPGEQGICEACGLPLLIKCPGTKNGRSCGKMNQNTVNVCPSCGFHYENVDKAKDACSLAQYHLDLMNLEAAQYQIDLSEQLWPGNELAVKIRADVQRRRSQLNAITGPLENACKERHYYQAKAYLEQLRQITNGAIPTQYAARETEIMTAINAAERYRQIAMQSRSEEDVINACAAAHEVSADCQWVETIMVSHKPAAPTDLQVSANPNIKANVLTWRAGGGASGSTYYVVRRKEGARPASAEDGELIRRVSGTSVNDGTITAGVEYYYAVYAERAGVYSATGAVTTQPVVNLFEISDVNAKSGDGAVELSWTEPVSNAEIEVTRTFRGQSETVNSSNRTGITDSRLVNDAEYQYHLALVYHIGTRTVRTNGVTIRVRPTKPPLAIDKVRIKRTENGVYQLTWENPENANVQFYYAQRRPDYTVNQLIPVSELQARMKEVMLQRTGTNAGSFRYHGEESIYLMAVVIKGNTAVAGAIVRAGRGSAVKVNSVFRANGKIIVKTDMPKECTGYVVLWRHDHHPVDMEDQQATRKFYSLKQYEYSNGLEIDDTGEKSWYITVFAQFRHTGGDIEYSEGVTCELAAQTSGSVSDQTPVQGSAPKGNTIIYYSIEVKKKMFGGSVVTLTFHSDEQSFRLPNIDVMWKLGAAPIYKQNANLYQSIPGEQVTGSKQVTLAPKAVGKNAYIKPFLADEDRDGRIYTLQIQGTMPKIS